MIHKFIHPPRKPAIWYSSMLCICRHIKQIEELKSENKVLKGNIEELKSKAEKLKGKNEELKGKNEELKSQFNEEGS